jgi:hypothetical protein
MHGPMLAYAVDVSRWPLVVIGATDAVRDNRALEATYAAIEAALARRQPFVAMIDVRGAVSDPTRRKRMIGFVQDRRAQLDHFLLATAAVVGSGLERGIVTAALWLLPGTANVRVFTDRNEAEAWLRQELTQRS